MDRIKIKANAKINLCLYITKTRQDGYHEIDSIFQSIHLFDYITLTKSDNITISCDDKSIPIDEKNICFKGAKLFIEKTGVSGVKIDIEKNIPVCAGLGGGSADVAAVIVGMNELFETNLNLDEMIKIGSSVGADVPFFMEGGCQRATGIGEKLEKIKNPFNHQFIVIKPEKDVPTPKAYQLFEKNVDFSNRADDMIKSFNENDEKLYLMSMGNALEKSAFVIAPDSKKALNLLLKINAKKAMVTGSGSAVFGLYNNGEGKKALKEIKANGFLNAYLVEKADSGLTIIPED